MGKGPLETLRTRIETGWLLLPLALSTLLAAHLAAKTPYDVPYPTDFRTWTHVKTMLVGPQSPFFESSGGIHHIYANEKAMEGYATGTFPDGSVLVFDLRAIREKDGTIGESTRQRVDVMLKDSTRFSSTSGWGFERFLGDSQTDRPLTEEHRKLCFGCHEQAKKHDFVFSEYRQ